MKSSGDEVFRREQLQGILGLTPSYEESYRRLSEPAGDVVNGGDVER